MCLVLIKIKEQMMLTEEDIRVTQTPEEENNLIFIGDGIFSRNQNEEGNGSNWYIILNKSQTCGWYNVNSPYVSSSIKSPTTGEERFQVIGRFNELYHMQPCTKSRAYRKENISFILDSDKDGYETVRLFLHNKGELISHLDPNSLHEHNSTEESDWWTPFDSNANWSKYVRGQFNRSIHISNLSIYSPNRNENYMRVHYGETEKVEYRRDPFNHILYTEQEFYDYYQRDLEWTIQDPKKIIQREKINEMISLYQGTLAVENINHLLDKLIATFN